MREKYESLPLVQLKELAKVRGLKGTSTMKKAELVEAMLAEDERLKKEEEAKAAEQKQESATETVRSEEPQKQERSERPVRPRNWTAVSKPAVFWKSCRMAMDLSVARIICPVRMMSMWHPVRSAVSD